MRRPSDAIPADLDLVLRIDRTQLESVFGKGPLEKLQTALAQSFEAPVRELLSDALPRSERFWIGLRPSSSFAEVDHVAVLRGDFKGIDPRVYNGTGVWGPAVDLGADYRVFERATSRRNEATRLYLHGNDEMVLVTSAELDSVERQVERGVGSRELVPPEQGAIAFALRLTWLRARWQTLLPQLSEQLLGAHRLLGFVELGPARVALSTDVACDDAGAAQQVAAALDLLRGELERSEPESAPLLELTRITAIEDRVHIELNAPETLAKKWIACAGELRFGSCELER
jgi:hypothetical protein